MILILLLGIGLNIDVAQFSRTENETDCEIYYSIPTEDLNFVEEDGIYSTVFSLIISVRDIEYDNEVKDTLEKTVNVTNPQSSIDISDVQPIVLSSNKRYQVKLNAINNGNLVYQSETTFVSRGWDDGLSLSDIQISHTLMSSSEKNRFVKNGYKLLPYPQRLFNRRKYLLASYCEIYGMTDDSILVTYLIEGRGANKDTVLSGYTEVTGSRMAFPMVSNILGFPVGTYSLKVIVESSSGVSEISKRFTIESVEEERGPSIPDSILEYASFLNYIASPSDIKEFNSLSESGKEIFLLKYWSRRDEDPSTRENETLNEFVRRVKYADENFSEEGRTGRRGRFSDRGRIYIKYGTPDDIIRRTSELEVDPYIMWHYYNNDYWFIFMDRNMSGDYQIIYAGVESEPSEPGWQNLIFEQDRRRIIGEF